MQFFFNRREKYKEEREKERKVLSNWRAENRRKKKRRKDFHVPFQQRACVCSFFLLNHAWWKGEKDTPTTYQLAHLLSLSQKKRGGNQTNRTTFAFYRSAGFFFSPRNFLSFLFVFLFFIFIYLRISPKDLRVRSIVPWYYDQILPSVPSDTLIGEIFQ